MRLAADGRKKWQGSLSEGKACDGKYKHGAICRPPYLVGERWRKLLVFLFASNALKV